MAQHFGGLVGRGFLALLKAIKIVLQLAHGFVELLCLRLGFFGRRFARFAGFSFGVVDALLRGANVFFDLVILQDVNQFVAAGEIDTHGVLIFALGHEITLVVLDHFDGHDVGFVFTFFHRRIDQKNEVRAHHGNDPQGEDEAAGVALEEAVQHLQQQREDADHGSQTGETGPRLAQFQKVVSLVRKKAECGKNEGNDRQRLRYQQSGLNGHDNRLLKK